MPGRRTRSMTGGREPLKKQKKPQKQKPQKEP